MTPRWRFREVHEDGGLVGGDQAAMSFKDDLGVFVRESSFALRMRRPAVVPVGFDVDGLRNTGLTTDR